jgi:SWI/SNF-related matrix-associated actin-dependent regulator of chromatin subfamily A-like protein 1
MRVVEDRFNVELRDGGDGTRLVVFAFPYNAHIVAAVRNIPHRRFEWDAREWLAPASDWAGVHVAEILERFPELTTAGEVDVWLSDLRTRWVGYVRTASYDGRGWWLLKTHAGTVPASLRAGSVEHADGLLVPFTAEAAEAIRTLGSGRVSLAATRCLELVELGESPPPAQLVIARGVDGERLTVEILWDAEAGQAFDHLPGATGNGLPLDPWLADELDAFVARHHLEVAPLAADALNSMLAEKRAASAAVRRSRADSAEPIDEVAEVLGGTLAPFQWAGVRYALEARRTFLADEQGLGKTVEALATLEADGAFPAVVVCPASMKLTWEREAGKWLPHRTRSVVTGRSALPPPSDITILNYEIVAAHRSALGARRPRALVVDESH